MSSLDSIEIPEDQRILPGQHGTHGHATRSCVHCRDGIRPAGRWNPFPDRPGGDRQCWLHVAHGSAWCEGIAGQWPFADPGETASSDTQNGTR